MSGEDGTPADPGTVDPIVGSEQPKHSLTETTGLTETGLKLVARELSRAMWRASVVQNHARFLEKRAKVPPAAPGPDPSLHAANAELHREVLRLRAEHDAMTRSTVWRVGQRLQDVARRHPDQAALARRVLKLGYWTATLRLPSRLRQRRDVHRDLSLLAATPLFDRDWYQRRYAAVLSPGIDPVTHYFWIGAQQGFDPHPLFDSAWYRSGLPDSTAETVNPLAHYLTHRGRGTPDPHPLFDTAFVLGREQVPEHLSPLEHILSRAATPDVSVDALRCNPVFEPGLYAEEYLGDPARAPEALAHYVSEGEAAGFWPHPLFDPLWYRRAHPDAEPLGPLAHYLHSGSRAEGAPCSEAMARLVRPVTLPLELSFPETETPRISIVVPIYGHVYETWRCLAAVLLMTERVEYEMIVADDRPARPVAPLLQTRGALVLVNAENLGFLGNCNTAARRARGRDLVFLNNDTTVGRNWLAPMVRLLDADPRVGVVGAKLLNTDGSVQEAGGIIYDTGWGDPFGQGDRAGRGCYNYVRDVDVVTGACFLVRRRLFDQLGGFDPRFAPAFYEEFDLATSIRNAGYRVVYQPASEVWHHGSASYGTKTRDRQTSKNHAVFCRKWQTLLAHQPARDDPALLSRERPSPRGLILVIDDKVPEYDRHAGAVTLMQYLELFRELGLRVVFAPHDGEPLEPYTRALEQRGIEVLHRPDTLLGWLRRYGSFVDYIWTARPDVTTPILPWLKRHTGARILYYTHDLHYLRERRRYELEGSVWALQEAERLKPLELAIFAAVDCVMTPSGEEARVIAAEVPASNVVVIPPYLYGDDSAAAMSTDIAERHDIIFIGGFDHTPNVDAAIWLATAIMPLVWRERPDVTLWIVGNVPPAEVRALEGELVRVTGFVPDLEPYLARARVSLSPLRYGAGVKGKIVTSLQNGVPVVTTGCGNEGIQLRDGQDALIGETAEELANAALRLLRDPSLCEQLITSGIEVVRTRFSRQLARRKLGTLLGSTLCPVCGIRPRQTPRRAGVAWTDEVHCLTCGSLNRDAALATIVMAPWRRFGVNVLEEGKVYLSDQKVHAFGAGSALSDRLALLSRFSRSEFPIGAPAREAMTEREGLPFADASVDLFLNEEASRPGADPQVPIAEIFRCLKPGGRYVFVFSGAGDQASFDTDRLASTGFRTIRHDVEFGADPSAPIAVFEATRPNT